MITFLKTQAASIIGSAADFLVTIVLVQVFHCWYMIGNTSGNICGAVTQFLLCKDWVFKKNNDKVAPQIIKFILMWTGNLLLSAAGVYLLTQFAGLNYLISKLIISILLGLTYNYLLLKKFVFV